MPKRYKKTTRGSELNVRLHGATPRLKARHVGMKALNPVAPDRYKVVRQRWNHAQVIAPFIRAMKV